MVESRPPPCVICSEHVDSPPVETGLVPWSPSRSGVSLAVLRRCQYNSSPRYRIAAASQAANTPIGYASPRGYLNASAAIAARIAPAISAMFASTDSRTRVLVTAAETVLPTRTAHQFRRPRIRGRPARATAPGQDHRVTEPIGATLSVSTVNGAFLSEFPHTRQNGTRRGRFTVTVGSGAAAVDVQTFAGGIMLKRQGAPDKR
jgi:hypothetical protein